MPELNAEQLGQRALDLDLMDERQLLDVYAPPSGSNLPVVVWVHGGGWMRSSPAR